jgi:hypothetical protein
MKVITMTDVITFYEQWDIETVEIDDEETLFWQLDDVGNYALVTDEAGGIPENLDVPVIFSVYTDSDEFQWSVTLDDSRYLGELIRHYENIEDLLQALTTLREEKMEEYMHGQ